MADSRKITHGVNTLERKICQIIDTRLELEAEAKVQGAGGWRSFGAIPVEKGPKYQQACWLAEHGGLNVHHLQWWNLREALLSLQFDAG